MYNDPLIIIIIFLAVLCGGLVKGTIGFGMPMVALPIIAFILPATKAMIILCAPIFITNFIQMKIKEGITSYRFLPMFLSLVLGLLIGSKTNSRDRVEYYNSTNSDICNICSNYK